MADIIDSAVDNTLTVGEILITEVKIQVVDCRTNKPLDKSLVSKIEVTNGSLTYKNEFVRDFEVDDTKTTKLEEGEGKIKESMQVLQRLGYETATTKVKEKDLPKDYDATWRGYYNTYWGERIPDFETLETGNPSNHMINHMIKEYNCHRATDTTGVLKVRIPHLFLDSNRVTVTVSFFNFAVALEGLTNESGNVKRVALSNESETEFDIKWNSENTQSTEWKGDFGWRIHKGDNTGIFKVGEDIVVKDNTNDFDGLVASEISDFHGKGDDKSENHFFLFALQWCQPVYDFIDDPDPDATRPTRSNASSFINMKHNEKWVRGLNMHIPSKHSGSSGPYYGIYDTKAPYPRGNQHQGVDLYSGGEGKNPAFAVHAGKLTTHSGSGYGYRAYLLLGEKNNPAFHYAHLRQQATAKAWVMAGEKVGVAGLTRSAITGGMSTFKNEPYHLHLELIKSATSTTGAIAGNKVVFSEIVSITPSANAKYKAPTGANAFLFQGNRLPLILPCKSVFCNSDVNGKDSGYLNGCKFGNTDNTNYKTCYAVQKFPYENDLLLSNITDMKSTDLHPKTGLIRYICPHILSTDASKKAQLQAKLKFIHVNKNRFVSEVFSHNNETVFNSFFTVKVSDFKIDGDLGNTTQTAIKNIIKAYYYCKNNDKEEKERTLEDSDTKIDATKITAFINKYTNGTEISTKEEYQLINEFYTWFNSFNFNNMCWNSPV